MTSPPRSAIGFLQRNVVRYWITPLVTAAVVFSIVQPVFAQIAQGSQTLAQYIAAGNSVVVGSGVDPSSNEPFRQIYYEYQGQRVYITSGDYTSADPATDGQYIAWMSQIGAGWQIFLHDLLADRTAQLTQEGVNVRPKISGQNVVWEGQTHDDWQVFLYDGVSVRQATRGDLSVNVAIEGDEIVFNRKNAQGEWRAVSYEITTDTATVIGNGHLSKFPEFRPGGTVVFRAEEEDRAYQAFLLNRQRQAEEAARRAEERRHIEETGLDVDEEESDNRGAASLEEALVVFGIKGCPALSKPVCAADGVSYLNACIALRAGTTPSSAGACDEHPIQMNKLWSANYDGGLVNEVVSISIPAPGGDEETEEESIDEEQSSEEGSEEQGEVEETTEEQPAEEEDKESTGENQEESEGPEEIEGTDNVGQDGESESEEEDTTENTEGSPEEGSEESGNEEDSGGLLGFVGDILNGGESGGGDDVSTEEGSIDEGPEEPETVTEEEIEEELEGDVLVTEEVIEGEEFLNEESSEESEFSAFEESEDTSVPFDEGASDDGLEIEESENTPVEGENENTSSGEEVSGEPAIEPEEPVVKESDGG